MSDHEVYVYSGQLVESKGESTAHHSGVHGDGRIHVVGMTGTMSADGSIVQLWLINASPSVDSREVGRRDVGEAAGRNIHLLATSSKTSAARGSSTPPSKALSPIFKKCSTLSSPQASSATLVS
ncbi:mitochondrial ribosomal protein subunit S4 [Fonsecaea nubica]|uniref:Mitochondrial ribosomal protein subunit S4 n=1 Tax=Fonsecaea nubica TaxID=856822 RepID=A0A178BR93_9EURO|nr:mitochondrial ribosomal protein subunit S4 [Fonsecaea nubica]OAL19395.1 mitochondrial ribosomal protein subunit S4 [Fonsecaea nubica]